jgi:lipoate-protein ligase A
MRLPRHDTLLRLSAAEGLAADEALLDRPGAVHWWRPSTPALVLGLWLRHRAQQVVEYAACERAEIDVLERKAGGGAVLLDEHIVCGAVSVPLPHAVIGDDLTESYRWLGDLLAQLVHGRRVDVAEARADVATAKTDPWLLATCYGTLSPHEVVVNAKKVVGLAQVRRKHAALFQIGILLRDQSNVADFLKAPDREALRQGLQERSGGIERALEQLQLPDQLP